MEAVSGWRLAVGRRRRDAALPPASRVRPEVAHGAQRGFTLVELVVAMSLAVIVVGFSTMFIKAPIEMYQGQARRAELVDSADNLLRDMTREVRAALPNSVRVRTNGSIKALELIATVDAVRYRSTDAIASPADELDFTTIDAQFSTVGKFTDIARPFNSTTHYLAIYNVGVTGADAYDLANVITPQGTRIQIADAAAPRASIEDQVTLTPAFRFSFGSPAQRVFLVSGAVTYLCDETSGTVRRYSGYGIAADQSARDTHAELVSAGATAGLLARNVAGCEFSYAAGAPERAGLVTMALTLSRQAGDSAALESVRLLHQAHVENAP
jgi:MSHA biogenesis protein MshO